MGFFYIDESVHDEAGFILGACIYMGEDLSDKIDDIIKKHGFNPASFEYKSSGKYVNEPQRVNVREDLKYLLHCHCRLGIVVVPRACREQLGTECIKALRKFIDYNTGIQHPVYLYFDQGMFLSKPKAEAFIKKLSFSNCQFFIEQNSKLVKGIQLADLAAHTASIRLKEQMGLVTKKVKAVHVLGYNSHAEIELGFEMWATLRDSFFTESTTQINDDLATDRSLSLEPSGLYISELCDSYLAVNARYAFASAYSGSVH